MELLNKLPLSSISQSLSDTVSEHAAKAALSLVRRQLPRLVDSALDSANQRVAESGLDPLPLPGCRISHSARLCALLPPLPAVANLEDAEMAGLGSVRQESDAEIDIEGEEKISAACHLTAGPLSCCVTCSGQIGACGGCLPMANRIRVACDGLSIQLKLLVLIDSKRLTVEKFEFNVGEIKVEAAAADQDEEEGQGGGGGGVSESLARKVADMMRERLQEAAKEMRRAIEAAVEAAGSDWPF